MATYEVFEHQAQLKVYADGRYLAAVQQGLYRPYVYPVRTLQGHVVTQAGPADHPHHLSIWLGHASVNGLNFCAPETLGMHPAPRILVRDTRTDVSADGVAFDQRIEWVDGAGGLMLRERRRVGVRLWAGQVAVDVAATLTAPDSPVELGADKDAGLALRIADQIDVLDGGEIRSATGARNEAATFDTQADWMDYSGPVTHEHVAGIAVFPHPEVADTPWFTRDYGPLYVSPWRHQEITLEPGQTRTVGARFAAHDGSCEEADVAGLYARFLEEIA